MRMRPAIAGLLAAALALPAVAGPRVRPAPPALEGQWTSNFVLPMEATVETPTLVVPEADAKRLIGPIAAKISKVFEDSLDPEAPELIAASEGLPIVRGERRTRAVVQPADGKLPMTAQARAEMAAKSAHRGYDNPEDRSLSERCLLASGLAPITDFIFENVLQIVITRDHVVLHTEYGDEVRIVRLRGGHGPPALAGRLGDSVGHWEGATLVVETVGLPDSERKRGFPDYPVPAGATVIERLTPVSDRELLYQFTVIDPTAYAGPWLAEFSWYRSPQPPHEHACHEGNYSLANTLSGARHEEAVAAGAAAAAGP